jgi:cyclohexanecarboxyl-CoA dehydrogenase
MTETAGFDADEEQEQLRASVRSFARREFASTYLSRAQSTEFPWKALRSLSEMGLLHLLCPPERGGPEQPAYIAAGIAVEELAYADFNIANLLIPPMIITYILGEFASPQLQDEWLPALTAGETFVALGLTEPEVGSDAASLRTRATRDADGWVISGEKTSITAVPHAKACVVFARTGGSGAGGVSAFLVPLDAAGVSQASIPDPGWKPIGRGSIAFDEVRVPDSAMIGGAGEAFSTVMAGFDFTRPLLALTAIGAAQASIDDAAGYVRDRQAFGAPLAAFEGVSFPLAEHATRLVAARALCYQALRRRERGQAHTALAAMCKWLGPRSAMEAAHDCMLLMGHYGYTTDNPMEQRLRDIMAVEIADGTAQVQKIIIARELFGREFVPYRGSSRAARPPREG